MSKSLSYRFDTLPPTPNRWARMHWATRAKWKDVMMWQIKAQGVKDAPEPCEIEVTWRVFRLMDKDNAHGRLKSVFDALVALDVLTDDNPKIIRNLIVNQKQCKLKEQGFDLIIREYLPFTDPPTIAHSAWCCCAACQ